MAEPTGSTIQSCDTGVAPSTKYKNVTKVFYYPSLLPPMQNVTKVFHYPMHTDTEPDIGEHQLEERSCDDGAIYRIQNAPRPSECARPCCCFCFWLNVITLFVFFSFLLVKLVLSGAKVFVPARRDRVHSTL